MATTQTNGAHSFAPAATVALSPSTAGIFHTPQITPESAKKASELLQENHVRNHVFFNNDGFHNHIAHHLLTIFALGANPSQLQTGFGENQSYQRPLASVESSVLEEMSSSRENVAKYFGKERHFRDYEEFFTREIDQKGVKATLDEWLFKGDEVAEGLLTRMYAGFYHPIIHFGFGLEFHQPAILTESLAQAAVHDNWIAPYLLGAESAAKSHPAPTPAPSLLSLLSAARSNNTIRSSPHPSDGKKTRDGVLGRAAQPMIEIARQFTVSPTLSDIRYKTAEMTQLAVYFTAAAQNPAKIPKFDFFYMHCVNASIFYTAFVDDPAVRAVFTGSNTSNNTNTNEDDKEVKIGYRNLARLLEMKARTDLVMYISRNSPELDIERIRTYKPKHPNQGWNELFGRAVRYVDDGHTSKLVRAVAAAERVCAPFEEDAGWPVRGELWLKIGHMVMDSVEGGGPRWVRGAGWEGEWKEVPDLDEGGLGKL